jgi:ectoine hydroxylase-related dioxygenase (phytanoyl-CoA dioxygenase family)
MRGTAPVNGIEDALRQCGVTETTLAPAERDALDRLGYLVLPDVIDPEWLVRLRAAVEAALGRGQRDGQHVHLDWTDPVFDGVHAHPRILAAVYQVLRRPFQACGVTARAPAPGQGLQGLHTDFPRAPSEPFHVVTALWLLDDFTPDNGATRVVPGTHRMAKALPKAMQQPQSRHPDQKLVLAEAGSVLVFNGHLWHGGTRNESNRPRRALQGQFRAREMVLPGEPRPEIP